MRSLPPGWTSFSCTDRPGGRNAPAAHNVLVRPASGRVDNGRMADLATNDGMTTDPDVRHPDHLPTPLDREVVYSSVAIENIPATGP
jgi:hypothetical protein